jgi:hypothetical protein
MGQADDQHTRCLPQTNAIAAAPSRQISVGAMAVCHCGERHPHTN